MFEQIMGKVAAGAARLLRARGVRRLARREDGTAAVEFAIVVAPFLALVFAIIETGIVFFAGQTLETAVADASRLIITGQAQAQGFTQAKFKEAMCARIFGLFDCANGVSIDVRTSTSFSSTDMSKPVNAQGQLQTDNFAYTPGGPGQIVVVRAVYAWPVYVSLLGFNLSDLSGSKRLLMATAAFRNEPF